MQPSYGIRRRLAIHRRSILWVLLVLCSASITAFGQSPNRQVTWGRSGEEVTFSLEPGVLSRIPSPRNFNVRAPWSLNTTPWNTTLVRFSPPDTPPNQVWRAAVRDFGSRGGMNRFGYWGRFQGTQIYRHLDAEFIVVLRPGVSRDILENLHDNNEVDALPAPFGSRRLANRYVVCRPRNPLADPLRSFDLYPSYLALNEVESVWPNFVLPEVFAPQSDSGPHHSPKPDPDPLWHVAADNDADIDLDGAWTLHDGGGVLVSALSSGTLETHEALAPHFVSWVGFDFYDGCVCLKSGCCDYATDHGTSVTGVLAGKHGASPGALLVAAQRGTKVAQHAYAIETLADVGVRVVSISQSLSTYGDVNPLRLALDETTASVLFCFSAGNKATTNLDGSHQAAEREDVLAVGGCRADHSVSPYAYGAAIDVVAPAEFIYAPVGASGDSTSGYTTKFDGTSAAAPMAAGVAALVLSADPTLDPLQVIQLLQDTADKIDPDEEAYSATSGRCTSTKPRSGYGRINAYEAVWVVSPKANDGVDLFIRDHPDDWGNTDQPSSFKFDPVGAESYALHQSPDIALVPSGSSVSTAADFAALGASSEYLAAGSGARIAVRLRNRGPYTESDAEVRLFWQTSGAADWESTAWKSVGKVPYSGASVAGTPGDPAVVLTFDLEIPSGASRAIDVVAVVRSAKDFVDHTDPSFDAAPSSWVPEHNNVARRTFPLPD